jgi:hypothetical protein
MLPGIPGHVASPGTGRNYPVRGLPSTLPWLLTRFVSQMEGSAVMLPQHAPYTDPVQILICGGSTPVEGDGLDNCVSIAPEAKNPTWTLERSVSPALNST